MGEEITEKQVEVFERLADLKLKAERRKAVAGILSVWVPAANELSRKMAELRHRAITPNVRFTHPVDDEVRER
ncbi:MAG: hypothetical protein M3R21_09405 [Candidatus Dormibacteraeota bacterium]|nr:hypothetical protein [Candidatus Dormibacteraeota bacterium]